jgi:hypothetical protein
MALNPNIILSGAQPDLMGTVGRANEMAQQRIGFDRQNALGRLYQEQGPGIMAGERGALNALAQFDPNAALGVQGRQQDMQATQQRMDMLSREEQRQIAAHAASLSAAERVAEAAKIENGVKMGLAAQTPQQWDQMMQAVAPELVGQFDQRDMLANRFMSIADILKRQEGAQAGPEFRPATAEEAARYGAMSGQINTRTGQFTAINPPRGMSVETGPDGQLRIMEGPGVAGSARPFTEGQSKDNVYATRAEGALSKLEPVAGTLTSIGDRALNADPTGMVRSRLQSDDFQVAQNAGEEFLQAILRKDTGAAITAQEQELYGKTYLPQPGDNPAVLEAKREARARAFEALRAGMSAEQIATTERALVDAARRSGAAPTAAPRAPVVIDGFTVEPLE